jgi:hypothetical protein
MRDLIVPDWKVAAQVWWALTWRMIIVLLPLSFLAGGIFGAVGALMGVPLVSVKYVANIIGLVLGISITIAVLHRLLTKGFGKYRLQVVEK